MKRLLGLTLIILALAPAPALAHVLKTDRSIGAIMHIDPNDSPQAGQPATFFFEFKDKQNKFQPAQCSCQFEIDQNGQQLFQQPLFQNSASPTLTSGLVSYTFVQADVYKIKVIGQPNQPGLFQPFVLTYDVRVTTGPASGSNRWLYAGFGIALGIFVIIWTYQSLRRKPREN